MSSSTVLKGTDAGLTPLTVLHAPRGSSNCHAVQFTERATSGQAGALSLVSYNSESGALQIRATGPYLQAFDGTNTLKFELTNSGALSLSSSLTAASVTTTGALSAASAAVTGDVTVGGTLGVTGATTLSSTLGVTGASTFTGAVTINNDLTLQGTGKAYRFRRSGSALDLDATGVDLLISNFSGTAFDGTQRSYFRLSADAQNIQVAGKVEFAESLYGAVRHVLDGAANTVGFHGATPVARQTVSGSRASGAALADLLTKLATVGLIVDGSSA